MHPSFRLFTRFVALVATFSTATVLAQTPAPPGPPTPPPPAPVNHEFDFWIGEWNVTTPDGKPAGTSRVESVSGGHALLENWTGDPSVGGGNGKSLNAYNRSSRQWQQFWVGSGGNVLELSGGLLEGKMVLLGSHIVQGQSVIERITWTPSPDGAVRQVWDQSRDAGKTWQRVFDGIYRSVKH